jgi:hypothetical protein
MGGNYYLLKPNCYTLNKNYDYIMDKHNLFVHVCRTTNGIMIWNIDPKELNEFMDAGCQPYFEDGTIVSWNELFSRIKSYNHNYEYVGKNIIFF